LPTIGLITVLNVPTNIARGSEFELDITLSPTAVEPVNLIVESLSNLITPGSERVVYGIEQSLANEIFYVPEANVGAAELIFRSRSLRDYAGPNCEPLSVTINVQGEISSNLEGMVIGTTRTAVVTVSLHPPAQETIVVDIDTNGSGTAPASITFNPRDHYAQFELTVTAKAFTTNCVTFSSTFYQSFTSCYNVAGIFTSDIPEQINTHAVEIFGVTAIPPAGNNGIRVGITTSPNVVADPFALIQPLEDTAFYKIDALDGSSGWIEFSANGYITERIFFSILDLVCDESLQVISQAGTACLQCPATNGVVCNNKGDCLFSEFASELARCVCEENWYGPECEFFGQVNNLMILEFLSTGATFTTGLVPSTFDTEISIPAGLLQDGRLGEGTFYLQPYIPRVPFYGAIDPKATVPTVDNFVVSPLPSGFNFDIVGYDNTQVLALDLPLQWTFEFDSTVISQREFIELALYLWLPGTGWVPASSVCSPQFFFEKKDLLALTYRTNLCYTGQYQFFQVTPDPAHTVPVNQFFPTSRFVYDDLHDYYTTSGLGGLRGVEPPQPHFTDSAMGRAPPARTDDEDSQTTITDPYGSYDTSSTKTADITSDQVTTSSSATSVRASLSFMALVATFVLIFV